MRYPCVFITLIGMFVGCGSPPPEDPPEAILDIVNEIPSTVSVALMESQEFEVLSLDPKRRDINAPAEFFRRRVIGKVRVTDSETRKQILAALNRGVSAPQITPPSCFDPRHAIHVKNQGTTYYIVICFECLQVEVFVDDELDRELNFRTTDAPEEFFDSLLRAANVPVAEPGMLEEQLEIAPQTN